MTVNEVIGGLVPLWLARAAVIWFGLIWGSFLNVVIYRVPREMSVVRPASHCPGCGKPVRGYDNIPVLSFLILRGRARCCGVKMSPRYPVVELIGGMLSLAIFEVLFQRLSGETSIGRFCAIYGADFALALALVAAAFIDAEHMFLPDSITIGGIVVGVATSSFRDMSLKESIIGGVVGFAGVYVPFIFLYKGLLGRTGMGMGDAKLLALAGAWFGWPGAIFTLFAGALQGTVYAVVTRVLGIKPKLPEAVQQDIDELKKAASEGDEEAKKLLEEDPLTEDESDAFIIRFFTKSTRSAKKLFGIKDEPPPPQDEKDERDEESEEPEEPRARLPFGPFLILAILELLFAGDLIARRFLPLFWPE